MRDVRRKGVGRQPDHRSPLHINPWIEPWRHGHESTRHVSRSHARHLPHRISQQIPRLQGRPAHMVDEISGEDFDAVPKRNPAELLDRRFLSAAIWEHHDEVAELVRPIMRKYIGQQAMTTEEYELAQFFEEEAVDVNR